MAVRVQEITLREVHAGEAALLSAIHAQCFPHYWNPEAFNDFFAITNTFALLAEHAGEPVGMVVIRPQFEQADILTLAVCPDFRRQGVADQLLAAALAKTDALATKKLFLEVEEGNTAAIALYEKAGFSHSGRRKLYYRQKDGSFTDALVMSRKV